MFDRQVSLPRNRKNGRLAYIDAAFLCTGLRWFNGAKSLFWRTHNDSI